MASAVHEMWMDTFTTRDGSGSSGANALGQRVCSLGIVSRAMPPVADYPPLSSRSGGLLTRLWRPAHASRSSGGRPAVSAVSPSMPSIAQYRPVLPSIPCLACDRAPARTLPMLSWHGGGGAEEGRGVYGFVGMRWYGRLHIRV